MLKRKIVLFLMMLMTTAVISIPKNVYAGTCECTVNGSTRLYEVRINNCDRSVETAYCKGLDAKSIADATSECECKSKSELVNTGKLSTNSCECSAGGNVVVEDTCVSSTPNPICVRGQCICSEYTSLGSGQTSVGWNNTTSSTSDYDPFAGCTSSSINTALGCIPVEMEKFVPWLLTWLFGVAGGIAFLLMSYGFILIATSAGDEKKVQGARETITSAVIGLLVCIFAIFILRLIAVNILQIPGIN